MCNCNMDADHLKNMQMRKLKAKDLEEFNDLLRYAFQVTEEKLAEWGWENDSEIRKSKFPVLKSSNVLGWFDEENKLVSQIAVYPMKMNIRGTVYDLGFITGVATYPEYSGKGLMSSLMKQCLTTMREKGQTISLLYPYSIPLYRHKGWEFISDKMTFEIKDTQLTKKLSAPGMVKRVEQDSEDLINLHDEFAQKTHGCLFRNEIAWEEYWSWESEDITIAIYYDQSENPAGYLVYLVENDIFKIREIVCLNTEAWNGIWAYIGAHESMVSVVTGFNYSNNPIAFWLEDGDIKETIRPYIMGRIIDIPAFINKYKFKNATTNKTITFVVKDTILEENNKSFTVQFSTTEKPKLIEVCCENTVELSIGTLTALLLGYKKQAIWLK